MSEQRYTWYPDSDTGPCYINHWPVERQLAPSWFRGNAQGGNVLVGSYTWPDGERTEVYRDDLRKGWHVVPEGVRYVAVQGVKAGQSCYRFVDEHGARMAVDMWNKADPDKRPRFTPKEADYSGWTVLDLHDLGDKRQPCTSTLTSTTFTPDPAPRFVVKPASEMREGEPTAWQIYTPRAPGENERLARRAVGRLASGDYTPTGDLWMRPEGDCWGIVDTHSPEWKAFQAKHGMTRLEHERAKAGQKVTEPPPEGTWTETWTASPYQHVTYTTHSTPTLELPKGPTDAEVVEVWERMLNGQEIANGALAVARVRAHPIQWSNPHDGGATAFQASYADYQAARSRELNRRVTASSEATKEAERRRVLGPIDDPEHA